MLNSLIETIGNTPTVRLSRLAPSCQLVGKLESRNPLFCVKCRTAWGMIEHAERNNLIHAGDTVVEPTSGNTGVGLAWICRIRGYNLQLTMPESMSIERRAILKYLGAQVVLTPAEKGMTGAVEKARELAAGNNFYMPNQFANPGNVEIHYRTTGPEIWQQTEGQIDIAVFGVGTGGTLTGTGRYLKEQKPQIKIIAVEPTASPVLSGGQPGKHKIQGIGAGFVPEILDRNLIDGIEQISNEDAISWAQKLAMTEGIFAGISSGAAVCAAHRLATAHPEKVVLALLPDTAERYLSTDLFL